jgi:prevent-host-death family protein
MAGDWSVAEAKARFSELLAKAASEGPQHIRRNGREAAVVVSAEAWAKLKPRRSLVDVLLDPGNRVLSRDEVDVLFTREDGADRPPPFE